MSKFSFLLLVLIPMHLIGQAKDPFALYVEKTKDWYPSIFQLYIQQYADIHVNRYLIDAQDIESIKFAIGQFKHTETSNIDKAIDAVSHGKKVFFFIGNYAWGGLEQGTVYSGSWQRQMPLCSGFYLFRKKCFQKEGLNYHCGKKTKAHKVIFYIMS
jgi:hypothetical protein